MKRSHAAQALGALFLLAPLAAPVFGQTAPAWTLSAEQRIAAPGQSTIALTTVGPVLVDPAGALYVAQPEERLIRKIDTAGRQVAVIGRAGQGPGEFNTRDIAMTWKGDTLMALDGIIGSPRIVAFSRAGAPLATRVVPPVAAPAPFTLGTSSVAVMNNGLILLKSRDAAFGTSGQPIPPIPWVLADQTGRIARVVAALAAPFGYVHFPRGIRGVPISGKPAVLSVLSDDPLVAVAPDGAGLVIVERRALRAGVPAAFVVARLTASGDTSWVRRLDYAPPQPVSQATRDSLAAIIVPTYEAVVDPATVRSTVADMLAARTYYAPVTAALIDADNRTWLALRGANEPTARWLVLDPAGTPIGSVMLPRSAQVVAAQAGRVWVLEKDRDDVSILVRHRIGR